VSGMRHPEAMNRKLTREKPEKSVRSDYGHHL
jgi:hypothetical protein